MVFVIVNAALKVNFLFSRLWLVFFSLVFHLYHLLVFLIFHFNWLLKLLINRRIVSSLMKLIFFLLCVNYDSRMPFNRWFIMLTLLYLQFFLLRSKYFREKLFSVKISEMLLHNFLNGIYFFLLLFDSQILNFSSSKFSYLSYRRFHVMESFVTLSCKVVLWQHLQLLLLINHRHLWLWFVTSRRTHRTFFCDSLVPLSFIPYLRHNSRLRLMIFVIILISDVDLLILIIVCLWLFNRHRHIDLLV